MTSEWMSVLKSIPIDWLLEASNPSVRFLTMRDLLDYRSSDAELIAAREDIVNYKPVQNILKKQNLDGSWISKNGPYLPKFKSSYWQVMLLGMFGMSRTNSQIENAVNHLLGFQHAEGGFTEYMENGAKKEYEFVRKRSLEKKKEVPRFEDWVPGKIRETQMSCLTGNVGLALIRLGYSEDKAVKEALKWLIDIQNADGGWLCPYWGAHKNDKHSCFMGTITPLDAFSETPKKLLNASMKRTIERGMEFLLMHRLYKSDHHDFKTISDRWLFLTFPQFFYDIVRGLSVITKLGCAADSRIDDALNVLMSKRLVSGEWPLEKTQSSSMHSTIEPKGRPSKWITLDALRIIKRVVQTRGHLELNTLK
ncbi:MAG: prenyltransferase/squalene oxidase repeat-containing protein [Candidatus Thorarchaeota archaeon]